ncbi:MAG: hydroxylamine reductase [Deltaproteobacteria bacterium]|jgi:hydroxylamine reductase|nr:hydroxylamine reductase [Deltaproteobacteria bacterium]
MTGMFCQQCEQTAAGRACESAGICGKNSEVARLQDELTGALIGAARDGREIPGELLLESLFATLTNVNFDPESLAGLRSAAGGPGYDMNGLWGAPEDSRSLRTLLLLGIRGAAAYAHHAGVLGADVSESLAYFRRGLAAVAEEGWGAAELLPLVLECGDVNLKILALLDEAHYNSFGQAAPAVVSRTVEPGPFVVVTGHDMLDLSLLLKQTEGRGVAVYTHGEMLNAHGYPELKKYPHLKGHVGTAWPNQQKELASIPGAVLFTTNCLMPPLETYRDRVFTTSVARWPGVTHVDGSKDFSPVIDRALELGGHKESRGDGTFSTGYGHRTVLSLAGTIVQAVKSGAVRRFFLVGGCDGHRGSRSYFRDFVEKTPPDTVVLTLGCGKFRFNDLDLGTIGGIPRLIDMGQCNDAYGAVRVAVALAGAFDCGVNDLPLSLVISWYEQKAVAILLSLLHLGIKKIVLGPSLPAFVSPAVLNYLVENYQVAPTTSVDADLARLMG